MTPPIPDKPQLFCQSCQTWKPRAAIVATKWVKRRVGRQAQYACSACKARMDRTLGPRRGD